MLSVPTWKGCQWRRVWCMRWVFMYAVFMYGHYYGVSPALIPGDKIPLHSHRATVRTPVQLITAQRLEGAARESNIVHVH